MVKVKALNESQLKEYFDIRIRVFVDEQNVPLDLEYDEYDTPNHEAVTHIGAFIDDTMVGAMRLIKNDRTLKVGRLAVLIANRKDGVGSAFLKYAEKQAENNGIEVLELGAQVAAMPFYEKNGYQAYGPVFLDADIDHIMMKKEITKRCA